MPTSLRCGLLAALLALHAYAAWAGQGRTVVDDAGHGLQADPPARRIVALAPNLAELVFAAGAGAQLVGTVRGSDYPAAAAHVTGVGDAAGIDVERVLALRPDLVLAWASGNRPADVARLEALGLRVYRSEARTLEDVASSLRRIGQLAGTASTADAAAREYENALAAIAHRVAPGTQPTVFIQIWDSPLMTVNGQHLVSRIVERCGGRNVFANLPVLAGSVSLEAVLAADPDLIVAAVAPGGEPAVTHTWRRWPKLRAVARGEVHAIDADLVTRATPRVLQGVRSVCAWIATGS